MPGTYIVGEPLVTIAAFAPQLQVRHRPPTRWLPPQHLAHSTQLLLHWPGAACLRARNQQERWGSVHDAPPPPPPLNPTQVIASKQRPRKLTIHGGDGAEYMFLLKGHEVGWWGECSWEAGGQGLLQPL